MIDKGKYTECNDFKDPGVNQVTFEKWIAEEKWIRNNYWYTMQRNRQI